MKVIGVTGPTGSGKSLLCDFLSKNKIPVIDADEVYHGLLIPPSPCLDALRGAFGDEVFLSDGSLNRPALSKIVFRNEEKLILLNKTVLGFVLDRINEMIGDLDKEGKTLVAIDAPTLIESGFHKECDTVISVLSSPELRLARIMERDGISREAAEARIQAQKNDDFYRMHSDFVLINTEGQEEFFASCKALLSSLVSSKKEAK